MNKINYKLVFTLLTAGFIGFSQPIFSQTLYLYQDNHNYWLPEGWMPDGNGISVTRESKNNPFSGSSCIKLSFELNKLSQGWAGIYWLAHESWKGPGINIYQKLGISAGTPVRLSFRVRGDVGGERVQFKIGGISDGNDSIEFPVATSWLQLSSAWSSEPVSIDLSGEDLSNVVGGFCVVTNKPRNHGVDVIAIYLDDIKFEVVP